MTESSQEQMNERAVLIERNGELSEFAALLNELAVPIEIHRTGLPTPNEMQGAAVAIVQGNRLNESGAPNLSLWPRTIAVVDDASKTLVSHLNRLGVAMVIRRPIHPRTLRLLLLHEIYQGPERRNRKRTPIGHPVRVGSGLFKQRATLLDLSPGGARLELPNAPKKGSKLRILIGKDLTLGKPLKLEAKVVRSIRASGKKAGEDGEVGVGLLNARREAKGIRAILDRFASGPASWNGRVDVTDTQKSAAAIVAEGVAPPQSGAPEPPVQPEVVDPSASARRLPPSRPTLPPDARPLPLAAPAPVSRAAAAGEPDGAVSPSDEKFSPADAPHRPEPEPIDSGASQSVEGSGPTDHSPLTESNEATQVPGPDDPSERRSDPRIPYDRRVVALGEEAARVLVGRDLSQGGMRIAAMDSVEIGDVLRVALHSGDEMEPLVVLANAARHDGDSETVLTFQDLSDSQHDRLEKIIASSSPIRENATEPGENDPDGQSIVFGEMLETLERDGKPVEPIIDPADGDFDIDAHLDSIFDTGESVEDVR